MANAKRRKKKATLNSQRSRLEKLGRVSGSGILAAVDVLAENHPKNKTFEHMKSAADTFRKWHPSNKDRVDAISIDDFIGYCACTSGVKGVTSEEFTAQTKKALAMKSVEKNLDSAEAAQTLQNAIQWDSLNKQLNGRSW